LKRVVIFLLLLYIIITTLPIYRQKYRQTLFTAPQYIFSTVTGGVYFIATGSLPFPLASPLPPALVKCLRVLEFMGH
jgi:hypothetical protein